MTEREELRIRLCRRLFEARIGAKQKPGEPITLLDEEWIDAVLAEIERTHVLIPKHDKRVVFGSTIDLDDEYRAMLRKRMG